MTRKEKLAFAASIVAIVTGLLLVPSGIILIVAEIIAFGIIGLVASVALFVSSILLMRNKNSFGVAIAFLVVNILGGSLVALVLIIIYFCVDNESVRTKSTANLSIADSLSKWHGLLKDGAITQEEFDKQKALLLKQAEQNTQPPAERVKTPMPDTRKLAIKKWLCIGLICAGSLMIISGVIVFGIMLSFGNAHDTGIGVSVGVPLIVGGILVITLALIMLSMYREKKPIEVNAKADKFRVTIFLVPIASFLLFTASILVSQITYINMNNDIGNPQQLTVTDREAVLSRLDNNQTRAYLASLAKQCCTNNDLASMAK